jgi:hypothetical protein
MAPVPGCREAPEDADTFVVRKDILAMACPLFALSVIRRDAPFVR